MKKLFSFSHRELTILTLCTILLFSLFPRVWKLTEFPPIIIDEPANIRDIQNLLSSDSFHPADFEWAYSQGTLVYYPTILLIHLGISDHFLALRLTSVILSLIALIPFFFLIKKYTSFFIAVCTTILFSYSYYYLQFSRVGWTNIHMLTIGLFFLWFIELIQEKNKWWTYLGAGICAGILLYTYRAGQVYLVSGGIVVLIYLLKTRITIEQKFLRIFLFLFSFLIVSSPWIYTILFNFDTYNTRTNAVSIFNAPLPYHGMRELKDVFIYQISTVIKTWILFLPHNAGGIEAPRYLPLTYPIISYPLIPFFYVGFLFSLFNIKKMYPFFLIFFLGIFFGQLLTVNPPNGSRGLLLLPIIYLFIGVTLQKIYRKFYTIHYAWILILLFSLGIATFSFLFYQSWMSWIKIQPEVYLYQGSFYDAQ